MTSAKPKPQSTQAERLQPPRPGGDLVDRTELARRLSVSRATTYRMGLPAPYQLSPRVIRWDWTEIERWVKARRA